MFTQPFEYLARAAKTSPAALAVSSVDTALTYDELYDSALRFAHIFREAGIQPGHLVGVRAKPLIDLVVSEALFHEAAIGSHVPIEYEGTELNIFDWIVTEQELAHFPAELQIVVDQAFLRRAAIVAARDNQQPFVSENELCRVSFSSGTTGLPKAIGWSIRCLEDRALDRRHQWMLDTPFLCMLGLSTGLGFMTFFEHVERRAPFVLAAKGDHLLSQLSQHGMRCVIGSPQQLHDLLNAARGSTSQFPALKTIMSAGGALPDALLHALETRFGAEVVSTYASSEAGSVAIRRGAGTHDGFAGVLFDDVEVRIEDTQGNSLGDGEIGRIGVHRRHQPSSYLFDPATSSQTFRDGFFFSGDLGYLQGNKLYLSGRESEIIYSSGIKIDPAKVESVAFEMTEIRDAAAFSFLDDTGLQQVGLAIVATHELDARALASLLRSKLGEAHPKRIVRVSEISRNHMGKVNRETLARLLSQSEAS